MFGKLGHSPLAILLIGVADTSLVLTLAGRTNLGWKLRAPTCTFWQHSSSCRQHLLWKMTILRVIVPERPSQWWSTMTLLRCASMPVSDLVSVCWSRSREDSKSNQVFIFILFCYFLFAWQPTLLEMEYPMLEMHMFRLLLCSYVFVVHQY